MKAADLTFELQYIAPAGISSTRAILPPFSYVGNRRSKPPPANRTPESEAVFLEFFTETPLE